jgi:hypothetical protein
LEPELVVGSYPSISDESEFTRASCGKYENTAEIGKMQFTVRLPDAFRATIPPESSPVSMTEEPGCTGNPSCAQVPIY